MWSNPHFPTGLVTFTEEILNGKLQVLCSENYKNLDWSKAHGPDMISISILKLCGESVLKPLEIIFRSCTESGNSLMAGKS